MKKVLLATMILLAGASFTSCSSSDEFYYDTVRCGRVEFNSNNQIDGMGSLYGDKLY